MIRVYNWDTEIISGNGLATLTQAIDVCLERKINGDCTLSLKLPLGDENWKYIREENILTLEGQQYRIKTMKGNEITAYPIYQDACRKHLSSTRDMIGASVGEILTALFKGSGIEVADKTSLDALGIECLYDEKTDFFEQSRITPLGGLKILQEQLEKNGIHNELYFDNKCIALVKNLGKDNGARLDLRLNASQITVTRDTTELITKLYPYGAGGFQINSALVDENGNSVTDGEKKYGRAYIESTNIQGDSPRLPVCEGYMTFDDIDDLAEAKPGTFSPANQLLEAARKQFAEDNPERIDVPRYTIEVDILPNVGGMPIKLGDIVEVNDPQYGLKTKQRVVAETYYPYEPHRSSITVGHAEKTVMDLFSGVVTQTQSMTNSKGEVKPSWLENLKSGYRTKINTALKEKESEKAMRNAVIHNYGDIWVDATGNCAMAIVNGVFAIASEKDGDDWKWEAFGDANGFTADKISAGSIKTSEVNVVDYSDEDQQMLKIASSLITMSDGNGCMRCKIGCDDNGCYVFKLYNAAGNETLALDDDGNITMKGVLDTRKKEEGACGYLVSGSSICGQKYTNNKFVNHGLLALENKYGTHLSLCVNGTEYMHMLAEDIKDEGRTITFGVNNLKGEPGGKDDSLAIFRASENNGSPVTRMYGTWDFCGKYLKMNGNRLVGSETPVTIKAVNGTFTVQNGLIVGIHQGQPG